MSPCFPHSKFEKLIEEVGYHHDRTLVRRQHISVKIFERGHSRTDFTGFRHSECYDFVGNEQKKIASGP